MTRMRWSSLFVLAAGLALPAHAATWSIGPSVGFDLYDGSGSSIAVVSVPAGSDVFLGGLRPGLRIGAWDASQRHQIFADVGAMAYSGSGVSLHVVSGTINYAHAFMTGSSPYVTA